MRTPDGPATLALRHACERVDAEAWGAGATWALSSVPRLVGLHDDPGGLDSSDARIRALRRRSPGFRIGASGRVFAALVPAILEQKVTSREAQRAWARLVQRHGEAAPGPGGLRMPPSSTTLAALPYHHFHTLGVERRRAETIRAVAARATRLELDDLALSRAETYRVLRSIPGVGPWTAAEVGMAALGDPDAVSVGDYHLKHLVCWALAEEPRGTDERMLELLEPYGGHRGRVCRLIELARAGPPRRAPRQPLRDLARL
jgi:3-methyladenine DNA glycosylase/8-oxoguanine DNA glycosylase